VQVFQSSGSTTALDIGFISFDVATRVIVLLAGGDKRTQAQDIDEALRLARLL
jgi:hypothetical protein